jgi:hypothetical protein
MNKGTSRRTLVLPRNDQKRNPVRVFWEGADGEDVVEVFGGRERECSKSPKGQAFFIFLKSKLVRLGLD